MRKILFLTLLLGLVIDVQAERVDIAKAQRVAERVLQAPVWQSALPAGLEEMYLFECRQGFVIVSADDCVRPVLAYGERWAEAGDTLPVAVYDWLKDYCGEIAQRRNDKVAASAATQQEWDSLMMPGDGPVYAVVVSPMLTTTWNQSPRYNNYCPSGCVAGCVATATAQVMKYWNHPVQGTGSHSYVDGSHGTLSADFGATTYQWSLMPNALSGGSSSTQISAVATLIYHIGVAVEMSYGSSSSATTGSSGSPTRICAENALKTYFGYSHAACHLTKSSMSDSLWCALIDAELSAARPILYSGRDSDGGHSFVLDGSNAAGHYHFNWGWGGYCNGYYLMGALNPTSGGTGGTASSTYNLKNTAIMGIRPASDTHPTVCNVSVTLTDATQASVSGAGAHSYGDTVSIKVTTNSGFRFSRWSDGVHYNPRRQVLDSSLNLTAIVEPINTSDTVYYANSAISTSYGSPSSGSFAWGIKLMPAEITQFSALNAVQLYDDDPGTYQIRIYRGGASAPATLLHQQDVVLGGTAQWVNVDLDTAVAIVTTAPLWVTVYCDNVSYPAAVSTFGGNTNGSKCCSGSGSWHNLSADYSFMVRAVFAPVDPCGELRSDIYQQVCDSYTWNGHTYTVSTVDSVVTTTADGCDSVSVLHLTVDYSVDTVIYDTATGSYLWNGVPYDQSGEYSYVGQTAAGCDSTVTLYLTVLGGEGVTDVEDINYKVYVENGSVVVWPEAGDVRIYDMLGRLLPERRVPAEGVYFIRIGDLPARRIVVTTR